MARLAGGIQVAVVAAMQPELARLRRRLGLRREDAGAQRVWRGRSGTREVVATVTAMGTEAAARATRRLLDAHPADHVLVVGIAGGIGPDLEIGELLRPESVVDERTGAAWRPTPLGDEPPRGRLLTTDRLLADPADVARLQREGCVAVDMETAAVARVAAARGVPWSVLRSVSDRAGDPAIDHRVVGLARPDGAPNPGAIARFLLTRPSAIPKLAGLAWGMRRAVRTSTGAALAALGAAP